MSSEAKSAFDRVLNARHPERPYSIDLIEAMFTDFVEIHGDRRFSDDAAMVCGFARLGEHEVAVIGQQKGRDTKQRQARNFGMPKPEGYRKAIRVMKLAEKFGRPVISFVDTPGAYPGIDAEERGQAEAIAYNLREMAGLRVPIIVVVLGEGGSGGALAIGIGDRVLMMENAVYSVITPEGCAAILWKDAGRAPQAAEALKLTADQLSKFDIVDEIVPEIGQWNASEDIERMKSDKTTQGLRSALEKNLRSLASISPQQLISDRYQKFRKIGEWV